MRIVSLSYVPIKVDDPETWLSRLSLFNGILNRLAKFATVASFHCIARNALLNREGVTYFFLKLVPGEKWLPFRLHRRVRKWNPDVVIVHSLAFPWQIILLRLQLGRRTRILVQDHKERPGHFLRQALQRVADRFVEAYLFTYVEQAEPWLERKVIAHPGKVKQLFEGSSDFHLEDPNEARKKTGVGPGLTYLWVGRLISFKDPLTVLRAFLRFLEGGQKGDLYMIFQTTDLLDKIKMLLNEHPEVASAVHLVGQVDHDELVHWYNSADFFILGSHDEATNISLCEAMSCGCVPIVTDIPAFREMTGHGNIGLLFPAGDEERLLKVLGESTRLDLASEKQKVLNQFRNELSFDAIAGRLIKILS